MNLINTALLSISHYLWVAVLMLVAWAWHYRKLDISAKVALMAWLVDDLITIALTATLYNAFEDPLLNRTVFYVSLTLISTACLVSVALFHYWAGIANVSQIAKLVSASLAILIALTLIRYIDRVVIELDALQLAYRYGVLSIKVCALPMLLKYILRYPRRLELAN
jgi:hypothetical protein